MTLDLFSTKSITGSVQMDYQKTVMAHGIMMFLAWGIFATTGIFLARYMKGTLGIWWFRGHYGMFAAGTLFTVIAFTIMVLATNVHFSGPQYVFFSLLLLLYWS